MIKHPAESRKVRAKTSMRAEVQLNHGNGVRK